MMNDKLEGKRGQNIERCVLRFFFLRKINLRINFCLHVINYKTDIFIFPNRKSK